jgi:hypothetical protein
VLSQKTAVGEYEKDGRILQREYVDNCKQRCFRTTYVQNKLQRNCFVTRVRSWCSKNLPWSIAVLWAMALSSIENDPVANGVGLPCLIRTSFVYAVASRDQQMASAALQRWACTPEEDTKARETMSMYTGSDGKWAQAICRELLVFDTDVEMKRLRDAFCGYRQT